MQFNTHRLIFSSSSNRSTHNAARSVLGRVALALLIGLAAHGCSGGGGSDSGSDSPNEPMTPITPDDMTPAGQREFSAESSTDGSGTAELSFAIPEDSTKLSVTAFSSGSLRFTRLQDSRAVDYLSPDGLQLSLSTEFTPSASAVTAPSRSLDPALDPSATYSVAAQRSEASAERTILFQVISRADPDLTSGSLPVNVFRIAGITGDPDLDAAVQMALDEFRAIYAQSAGIQVVLAERVVDGPVTIPFPFDGAPLYQQLSESATSPAVNLVIGGDVDGLGSEVLGISGGIPGPPIPSPRSAVAVSLITGAGPDGVYTEEEINVLAETMAHETGHFLGLFHPVEVGSVGADPLTDTPECGSPEECESTPSLAGNMMFPNPVFGSVGELVRQNQITLQQREVMNRYIAVN